MFDLRQKLIAIFDRVESNSMDIGQAKLLVSTAGNIIGSVKTQIKYHQVRQEKPKVKFVEDAYGK